MGERGRELDLQPSAVGMPADRLIAPSLVLLPVSGQEHTGRLPPLPPLGLGQAPAGEAAAPTQQGLPAPNHGHGPRLQLPFYPGTPGLQRLEPDGFGMPLSGSGVPTHRARLAARLDRQPRLDPADSSLQASPFGAQV